MFPWLRRQFGIPNTFDVHVTAPPTASEGVSSTQVFHDAAIKFLDVQVSTDDVLDARNVSVFSIATTVLRITIGLLNLRKTPPPHHAVIPLGIALFFYFCLIIASLRASRIRGLQYRPDLPTMRNYVGSYDGKDFQQWVGLEYVRSIEDNAISLVRKARWMGYVYVFLYLETLSLSIAAILTLL